MSYNLERYICWKPEQSITEWRLWRSIGATDAMSHWLFSFLLLPYSYLISMRCGRHQLPRADCFLRLSLVCFAYTCIFWRGPQEQNNYIYIYIYNIFACPTFWHYMYYIYDLINYESESDMIWERRIKSTRRSSCMTALAGQQPLPVCHTSRLVVTVSPPWWRRRRPSSFQQLCSSPRSPLVG